jgi:spore coat protein H
MKRMFLTITAAVVFLSAGCTFENSLDLGGIQEVRVHLDQDGLRTLNESTASNEYASCLYDDGTVRVDAQIKVRGGISRYYRKKSFTVRFQHRGRTVKYAFDSAFRDPSHIRNRLAMYAYRRAGLPAPRTRATALFINNEYAGYYTRLEMYSEPVLNAHYGDSCELFKIAVSRLGYDTPLRGASEKKFPDNDNFSSLELVFAKARSLDQESWNEWVSRYGNVEDLARYLVVHDYLAVGDTTNKNFYLCVYDRFVVLPWDNDWSMGRTYSGYPDSSADYPLGDDNLLSRKLVGPGSPVRARYNQLMRELFLENDVFTDHLALKVEEWYNEIDQAVYHEPVQGVSYERFIAEEAFLIQFLRERKNQISSPPFHGP